MQLDDESILSSMIATKRKFRKLNLILSVSDNSKFEKIFNILAIHGPFIQQFDLSTEARISQQQLNKMLNCMQNLREFTLSDCYIGPVWSEPMYKATINVNILKNSEGQKESYGTLLQLPRNSVTAFASQYEFSKEFSDTFGFQELFKHHQASIKDYTIDAFCFNAIDRVLLRDLVLDRLTLHAHDASNVYFNAVLQSQEHLKELQLGGTLMDFTVQALNRLKTLKKLVLLGCYWFKNDAEELLLLSLNCLEELELCKYFTTNEIIQNFGASCPNIKKLSVDVTDVENLNIFFCAMLGAMPKLEMLKLYRSSEDPLYPQQFQYNVDGMIHPRLKYLQLDFEDEPIDNCVEILMALPNLEEITGCVTYDRNLIKVLLESNIKRILLDVSCSTRQLSSNEKKMLKDLKLKLKDDCRIRFSGTWIFDV